MIMIWLFDLGLPSGIPVSSAGPALGLFLEHRGQGKSLVKFGQTAVVSIAVSN